MDFISKNKKSYRSVLLICLIAICIILLVFGIFMSTTRQRKSIYDFPGTWKSTDPSITIIIPNKFYSMESVKVSIENDEGTIDAVLAINWGKAYLYDRSSYNEEEHAADPASGNWLIKASHKSNKNQFIMNIEEDRLYNGKYKTIVFIRED